MLVPTALLTHNRKRMRELLGQGPCACACTSWPEPPVPPRAMVSLSQASVADRSLDGRGRITALARGFVHIPGKPDRRAKLIRAPDHRGQSR